MEAESKACRLLTLQELIAFYVALAIVLALLGALVSGSSGALVGLLLGAGASTVLYFTLGKNMIGKPVPVLSGPCPPAPHDENTTAVLSPM